MKKHFHNVTPYAALILVASLSLPTAVLADGGKNQTPSALSSTDKNTATAKRKILAEKEQQITNEAKESVLGTEQALNALEQNDSKKAIEILQSVSGKLDILLAKDPTLALIPADIEEDVSDFQGDAKTVKKALADAGSLLNKGKVQDAKQMLDELTSEIRITTVNIPLGSFPGAIKEAAALTDSGKTDDAVSVLSNILNMLVETTEIIPLPILRAESLLDQASALEQKQDLSKEKSKEEILQLTDEAKDKLKLAELLGYGGKDDYKTLYTQIDVIKETLHSEKSAATWEKIKQTLSDFKNKIMHPKK